MGCFDGEVATVAKLVAQLTKVAVEGDVAFVDHDDASGELFEFVHVVAGDHDGDAFFAIEILDEFEDVAFGKDVNAYSGFIQEEDFGFMHEHEAEVGAHFLAQAELAGKAVEEFVEAEEFFDETEGGFVAVAGDVPDDAFPFKACGYGLVPPQFGALAKNDANAANIGHAIFQGVHAETLNGSRCGCKYAGKEFDGGAFARAIGSGIGHDFATCNFEIHVLQGVYFSNVRSEEVFEDIAHFFGTLALVKGFANVGEFNHDVPIRGIVESQFFHSI